MRSFYSFYFSKLHISANIKNNNRFDERTLQSTWPKEHTQPINKCIRHVASLRLTSPCNSWIISNNPTVCWRKPITPSLLVAEVLYCLEGAAKIEEAKNMLMVWLTPQTHHQHLPYRVLDIQPGVATRGGARDGWRSSLSPVSEYLSRQEQDQGNCRLYPSIKVFESCWYRSALIGEIGFVLYEKKQ